MLSVFENVYDHRSQSHNSESVGKRTQFPFTLWKPLCREKEQTEREIKRKKKKIRTADNGSCLVI